MLATAGTPGATGGQVAQDEDMDEWLAVIHKAEVERGAFASWAAGGVQSTMDEETEEGGPPSKTTLSGEHGRHSRAKSPEQQERADSPGPSCVSMKSDRSTEIPDIIKDGNQSIEKGGRRGRSACAVRPSKLLSLKRSELRMLHLRVT
ncbi:hypothetical protein N1851_005871 [Merluccius polli]|uniref:Uncharacterized protein n=1 Tax=Merluccius polli TaxID=89951 RepID=A0AA47PAT3_MERPO|nr:hypothetical protein N1851_005871 [Merluccius polli]